MSRFNNLEFEEPYEQFQHTETSHKVHKDESYYAAQGQEAFERGEFEPALRHYARALEHNPGSVDCWVGQVRALIELEEFHEANLWADKALEQLPDVPELLAGKAVALARLGELQEALAFSDAAMMPNQTSAYLWLARADVMLARKERTAEYCMDKAMLEEPGNWVIPWLASRIRYYYRQFAAAMKLAQKAVETNASHATAWMQLGLCQMATKLNSAARTSFEHVLQIQPDFKDASKALRQIDSQGWLSKLLNFSFTKS